MRHHRALHLLRLRSIRQDLTIQMVQDIFVVEAYLRKSYEVDSDLRYMIHSVCMYVCMFSSFKMSFYNENPLKLIKS